MGYISCYNEWRSCPELTKAEQARLAEMTDDEIKEAFSLPLEFGTAGMRGILDMGVGRMNVYTVARATKGLASWIESLGGDAKERGVVISYDTRRFSSEFASVAAKVLAANGIEVYLFEDVRPVPMCSFAIRHLKCVAGIMITASHNPKIYNGYKVYGEDGAQMSPESTDKVVEFISKTPYFGIKQARAKLDAASIKGLDGKKVQRHITVIGKSVDDKYFDAIMKLSLSPEAVKAHGKDVRIVYTPIHGSGYMPVTTVLGRMGITVNVVKEQASPDPDFSTVRVPNPEEADTLKLGVELADRIGSDIVIGTDPDSDRMGIAVRGGDGKFVLLNGNQIGVLLLGYILRRNKETGTLPSNGAIVKTIVTTELARKLADRYGVKTFDVLTGFKFIGEKIKEWETSGEYTYLFGFEESYGSLVGTHARDKDAVVAAMMFAEMVCYYEQCGLSVYGVLQDTFKHFGYYVEMSKSVTFGGLDGMEKMKKIMSELRDTRFITLADAHVLAQSDFVDGVTYLNAQENDTEPITLPKTNALKLYLEGGDWICVRPSGTEPKLKFYVETSRPTLAEAQDKAEHYLKYMSEMTED